MKQGGFGLWTRKRIAWMSFNLEEYYGGLPLRHLYGGVRKHRGSLHGLNMLRRHWLVSGRHSDFIAYRIKSPDELKSWYLYLQDRLSGITCQT